MNKADTIRLNQRWIRETEEKIEGLNAKIAAYIMDINAYHRSIGRIEGVEE